MTQFVKNIIQNDLGLFSMATNFFVYFNDVHFSRIPKNLLSISEVIFSNDKKLQKLETLSKYLKKVFELKNFPLNDFKNQSDFLVLIPNELIENLCLYAGASVYSFRIKKLIKQSEVVSLKNSIGEELYYFAIKRSLLYSHFIPNLKFADIFDPINAREILFNCGKTCLEHCLEKLSPNLQKYFLLKFPYNTNFDFDKQTNVNLKPKICSFLQKILERELKFTSVKCLN